MKNLPIFLFLFSTHFTFLIGQTEWSTRIGEPTGKLTAELEKSSRLEDKAALALALSLQLERTEPDRSKKYVEEALQLLASLPENTPLRLDAELMDVRIDYLSGELKEGLKKNEAITAKCEKAGYQRGITRALVEKANILEKMGNHAEAVQVAQSAISRLKKIGSNDGLGGAYTALGNAHRGLGQFDKAVENMTEALRIYEKQGNEYWMQLGLANLAGTYFQLGDVPNTIKYAERVLAINPSDTSGMVKASAGSGHQYLRPERDHRPQRFAGRCG